MNKQIFIDKNGIKEEDKELALKIIKELRNGKRVFGNPGEGLRITLKKLEQCLLDKNSNNPLVWKTKNKNIMQEISRVKAGINGEIRLASYIEQIIKNDPKLHGIIFFASLSSIDTETEEQLGYIPDTDFIAVYGKNIMILDAKNITISENNPIYIDNNFLKTPSSVIMELKSSKYIWENIFRKENFNGKIDGCTVLISDNKTLIYKNEEWYKNPCRPIFVGDLREFLIEWISKIKDTALSLKLLTIISNTQIRKKKSDIKFSDSLLRFMN